MSDKTRLLQKTLKTIGQSTARLSTVISPRAERSPEEYPEPARRSVVAFADVPLPLKAGLLFLISYEVLFALLATFYLLSESPELVVLSRLDFGLFGFVAHISTLAGFDMLANVHGESLKLAPDNPVYTVAFMLGIFVGLFITAFLALRTACRCNWARLVLCVLIGLNSFYIFDAFILLARANSVTPWVADLNYRFFSPHFLMALCATPLVKLLCLGFMTVSSVNRWFRPGRHTHQEISKKFLTTQVKSVKVRSQPRYHNTTTPPHASTTTTGTTSDPRLLSSILKREQHRTTLIPSTLSQEDKAVRLRALKAMMQSDGITVQPASVETQQ